MKKRFVSIGSVLPFALLATAILITGPLAARGEESKAAPTSPATPATGPPAGNLSPRRLKNFPFLRGV